MTTTGEDDRREVYHRARFTGGVTFGQRPAVIVVDFFRGFTDPACALGSDSTAEVERARRILDGARRKAVPVIFTTIAYDEAARATTAWLCKAPSLAELQVNSPWVELGPRLGRLPSESLISKGGASAFFGPSLPSLLISQHVDTVLVMGATTSGRVRATVVDSVQHGFATFVVTDCCVDRSPGPHESSMFDMTAKYADPVNHEEVVRYFQELTNEGSPMRAER